jgi:hypothetical protein
MSEIESRLAAMGLSLPPPFPLPSGVSLPFQFVQVHGTRVLISGHGPQGADGHMAGPFGKLGSDLSVSEGYQAARLVALSILASLKRSIGDLDRVQQWHRVFGMVNSAAGFTQQPQVINGFSDLVLAVYGAERGAHTRSAVGMAELPFNIPVEIEGELSLQS